MNIIRSYQPANGYIPVAAVGELAEIGFGMLSLMRGMSQSFETKEREYAFIVLSGTCSITGDASFSNVGERPDVFSANAHTVYIPRSATVAVTAKSDVAIAVATAPAEKKFDARHITPAMVKSKTIGRDNWQRTARIMLDETIEAERLFIGEAIVPSGNWASFPPHRHDFDNLPVEVDMEELYFFKFTRDTGFGYQRVYNDARTIDTVALVRDNDAALIPEGYHPVSNAPGADMYYLWIMSGRNRRFLSVIDERYQWMMK
ncbi:MAG: 5-deoxy-glucuronate isomerase [Spirochaetota bacterium]